MLAARSQTTYVNPLAIARLYAVAGRHDQAFEWLDRSFEEREPNMPYLNAFPQFDGLRNYSSFQELIHPKG